MTAAQKIVASVRGKWYGDRSGYGMILCPAHEDKRPSCRIRDGKSTTLVSCYRGCDRLDIIGALVRKGAWPEQDREDMTISARLKHETAGAFCISHGGRDLWLPKSQVTHDRASGTFTMPAWLATEKAIGSSSPSLGVGRRYASPTRTTAPHAVRDADRSRIDFARAIWDATQDAGEIVGRYWREARGLTLPIPGVIRFGASVPNGYKPTRHGPAMVAMVQAVDGTFAGVHVTYLESDGSDKNRRAGSDGRLVFGCVGGCAIRLTEPADELAIGEGIESTASYLQEFGGAGWATMNTSGLRGVILPAPPLAFAVTLLGENDDAKGKNQVIPSEAAIAHATARLRLEGRAVRAVFPAEAYKDFTSPHQRAA
jgi:hypothetical protein